MIKKIHKVFKIILLLLTGVIMGLSLYHFVYIEKTNKLENELSDNPLYWVAPMDPNYKSDKPGKSPMGMELIPVYAEKSDSLGVTISPKVINNIGIEIAKAKSRSLTESINTLGIIKENKNNIEHIHLYRKAWIKELYVSEVGDRVEKGQVIAKVYSPELYVDEQVYLNGIFRGKDYALNSKSRLLSLGVSEEQIKRIEKNRKPDLLIDIVAPISGFVSNIETREGMYVENNTNILTIANLDNVWISAELFPGQAKDIKVGDKLIIKNDKINANITGKIDFISPKISPTTRTISVRATLNNEKYLLRPNLYTDISIEHNLTRQLTIPTSAIIRRKDLDYVIVKNGNDFFAKKVKIGQTAQGYTQILQGLQANDEVVISSHFLIDSESNIQESLKRLTLSDSTNNSKQNNVFSAQGIIKRINKVSSEITVFHQKMNMDMSFKLEKNIDINDLKLGESIKFEYIKNAPNNIIISISLKESKGS